MSTRPHRLGRMSFALIVTSIAMSAAVAFAMDAVLIRFSTAVPAVILARAVLFNGTGWIRLSDSGGP